MAECISTVAAAVGNKRYILRQSDIRHGRNIKPVYSPQPCKHITTFAVSRKYRTLATLWKDLGLI